MGSVSVLSNAFCVSVVDPLDFLFIVRGVQINLQVLTSRAHAKHSAILVPHTTALSC